MMALPANGLHPQHRVIEDLIPIGLGKEELNVFYGTHFVKILGKQTDCQEAQQDCQGVLSAHISSHG
jgi:hypothetical protein